MEETQILAMPRQSCFEHWVCWVGKLWALGLMGSKVQLRVLVSLSGWQWGLVAVPVSQCCAWVSQLALPAPHSLPEPPFPGAPRLPFPETARSPAHLVAWLPLPQLSRSPRVENPQCFECSKDRISVWRGRGRSQGSWATGRRAAAVQSHKCFPGNH